MDDIIKYLEEGNDPCAWKRIGKLSRVLVDLQIVFLQYNFNNDQTEFYSMTGGESV